jgi:PEP-CTERM motif-containing protein
MSPRACCALVAALALAGPSVARAGVVDFENYGTTTFASSISSGGFTFAPATGTLFVIRDVDVSGCSPSCASNGTNWMGSVRVGGTPASTQPVRMTESAGSAFLLLGFDMSELFTDNATTTLRVVFNPIVGSSFSFDFSLDGVNDSIGGSADFQTVVLPALWATTPLSSVDFTGLTATGGSGDVSLDNLQAQAIPEPTTLALLGLGLGAFRLKRKRTPGQI